MNRIVTVGAWLCASMACLQAAHAETPKDKDAVGQQVSPPGRSRPQLELRLSAGGNYRTFEGLTSTGLHVSPSVGVLVPSSRLGLHVYGYVSYDRGSTGFGLQTHAYALGAGLSAVLFDTLRVGPHLGLALLQVGRATRDDNIGKFHLLYGVHAEVDFIRTKHATVFAGGVLDVAWTAPLDDDLLGPSATLTLGGRFR